MAALAVAALFAGAVFMRMRVEVWLRPDGALPRFAPGERRATLCVMGFLVAAVALIAIVPALSRHQDLLFVEDGKLVETGCHMFNMYRYEFELADVKTKYVYATGKGEKHLLHIMPRSTGRTTRITLKANPWLDNLVAVAPTEMGKYAQKLAEKGDEMPAELMRLLRSP
ncbi:hypothetical protein ILFOPFJJ_02371 [Ensifer psoraleae]|uniref:hypothetical protein n=1 Tax=Sinorhizobium psoraleae TaxID=520838 RepID=UPI001569E878|nr:hypothetical protein [Sinorhizobium psoraleae]NRP71485.1 hypothetical protein [Sinorhizobium psoraleae]